MADTRAQAKLQELQEIIYSSIECFPPELVGCTAEYVAGKYLEDFYVEVTCS